MMHLSRSHGNDLCSVCRKDIHEGDPILYLGIGEGTKCHDCTTDLEREIAELSLDLSRVKANSRCPNCNHFRSEPAVRGLNALSGFYDEVCEDEFHQGADAIPVREATA